LPDGARWVWVFWDSCHPGAVQILNYFYAVEKIGNWAKSAIKKERPAKDWIGLQEEYLLNDDVEEVINALKGFPNDAFIKEKRQLLTYLCNNAHRMRYKIFQDKGYLIGSEPIEAANKQVAQARLKSQGQGGRPVDYNKLPILGSPSTVGNGTQSLIKKKQHKKFVLHPYQLCQLRLL
jgi:hypothetical protein